MNKQYHYRKHIKYLRYIFPIVLFLSLIILWTVIILFEKEAKENISPILILTIVILFEAIFIWKFMGRFMRVKVNIGLDAITYSNYKGDIKIKYEDIIKIEFPAIKYFGGWIKIKSKENTIRLTVVIENIQKLLMELKAELDNKGLTEKYENDKFFEFLETATFSDEGWQRVYRIWWKILLLTLITSGLGLGVGILFNFDGFLIFLSGLFSFIYPTIVFIITEIFFGKKIAKIANKDTFTIPISNLKYEERIYKRTVLVATAVYLIFLIVEILLQVR